jgi:hypothetical protein
MRAIRELDWSVKLPPLALVRRHPKDRAVERVRWPRRVVGVVKTAVPLPILAGTDLSLTERGFRFTTAILSRLMEVPMPGVGFCSGVLALVCTPVLEAPRRKRIPTACPCAGVCAGAPEGSPTPAATRKTPVTARAGSRPFASRGQPHQGPKNSFV